MSVHLLGGGRDVLRCGSLLEAFVREAREHAGVRTTVIALLLVREADDDVSVDRFRSVLVAAGAASDEIRVHAVVEGESFADAVIEADGVFVGGGLTPAYHDAFRGIRELLRDRIGHGLPYAGFSAGAAIAADRALVGGWLRGGVEICSEDASEDLGELEVRQGLGLVPFTVDVHAAQWGTLSRLVAAVDAGLAARGMAIDEHTSVVVDAAGATAVQGSGHVWQVEPGVSIRVRGRVLPFSGRPHDRC